MSLTCMWSLAPAFRGNFILLCGNTWKPQNSGQLEVWICIRLKMSRRRKQDALSIVSDFFRPYKAVHDRTQPFTVPVGSTYSVNKKLPELAANCSKMQQCMKIVYSEFCEAFVKKFQPYFSLTKENFCGCISVFGKSNFKPCATQFQTYHILQFPHCWRFPPLNFVWSVLLPNLQVVTHNKINTFLHMTSYLDYNMRAFCAHLALRSRCESHLDMASIWVTKRMENAQKFTNEPNFKFRGWG